MTLQNLLKIGQLEEHETDAAQANRAGHVLNTVLYRATRTAEYPTPSGPAPAGR